MEEGNGSVKYSSRWQKLIVRYGGKTKRSQRPDPKRQQAKVKGGCSVDAGSLCRLCAERLEDEAAAVHSRAWQGMCGSWGL